VKQTLLLLVAFISVCCTAQTTKSTSVTVKTTTTTYKQPKTAPMSASAQAFFNELELSGQEWAEERAKERAETARWNFIKSITDPIRDSINLLQMLAPPILLPVILSDPPAPVIDQVIVMPVILVKQPRTSTSSTTYTDRNGHVKTVTTTTRRY
jgi:hypothetical protein